MAVMKIMSGTNPHFRKKHTMHLDKQQQGYASEFDHYGHVDKRLILAKIGEPDA